MADPISGEIRVVVTETHSASSGSSASGGRRRADQSNPFGFEYAPISAEAKNFFKSQFSSSKYQENTLKAQVQSLGLFQRFLPQLAGMFSLVQIARSSQTISTTLQTIWDVLGGLVDVILAPFASLMAKVLPEIVPFLMKMAEGLSQILGKAIDIADFIFDLPGKMYEKLKDLLPQSVVDILEKIEKGVGALIDPLKGIGVALGVTWALSKGGTWVFGGDGGGKGGASGGGGGFAGTSRGRGGAIIGGGAQIGKFAPGGAMSILMGVGAGIAQDEPVWATVGGVIGAGFAGALTGGNPLAMMVGASLASTFANSLGMRVKEEGVVKGLLPFDDLERKAKEEDYNPWLGTFGTNIADWLGLHLRPSDAPLPDLRPVPQPISQTVNNYFDMKITSDVDVDDFLRKIHDSYKPGNTDQEIRISR